MCVCEMCGFMIDHMKYSCVSTDIGSKFPDRVEEWSLSNHTPFTGLDRGRMNSSPSPSHSSSLTLSKSAFPESGSPVSVNGAVLASEKLSSVSSTPSNASHLHGAAITSNQKSDSSTSCVSVATGIMRDTTNKSFDSQVEQSLNQALSNIFDC